MCGLSSLKPSSGVRAKLQCFDCVVNPERLGVPFVKGPQMSFAKRATPGQSLQLPHCLTKMTPVVFTEGTSPDSDS